MCCVISHWLPNVAAHSGLCSHFQSLHYSIAEHAGRCTQITSPSKQAHSEPHSFNLMPDMSNQWVTIILASAALPPFKESGQRQSFPLYIKSFSVQARPSEPPLQRSTHNPIINPCTDSSLGRIWPLPDSTFLPLQSAFVPILTPSLIYFFACPPPPQNPSPTLTMLLSKLHSDSSRADWGHLQAGVKQIRTSAKWISWLPLWTGGMCWVSPVPSCLGFSRWALMSLTQRLSLNGIIYLRSSLPLSPEGRSTRMCTRLLFIAGIHSK